MEKHSVSIARSSLLEDGGESLAVFDARDEGSFFTASAGMERVRMTADLKRAIAWGAGLGLGFALAGMALGIFKKVR
jgi:hypothetical protein